MRSLSLLFVAVVFVSVLGCQDNVVFSDYKHFDEGWAGSDSLHFEFEAPDTIQPYHLFFNTRLNESYPFNNLYIITTVHFPNGKRIGDTLEYEMAYPNGELMGEGFGSIKDSKLWFKSDIVFTESGRYTIKVQQAMRKMESIEPLDTLRGIMDFGLHIETNLKREN